MPAQDGLGFDDGDETAPSRNNGGCKQEAKPIPDSQPCARAASPKDGKLVAQDGVLRNQVATRSKKAYERAEADAQLLVRGQEGPEPDPDRPEFVHRAMGQFEHGNKFKHIVAERSRLDAGRCP